MMTDPASSSASTCLIDAARQLSAAVDGLRFALPVSHVYNPLDYAWAVHRQYLQRYGSGRKKIVFVGMNPGPFGMAQTGVPFGQIEAVRDWLGLEGEIGQPAQSNPKRPVEGFACKRAEVSGQRLWGLFHQRFGTAEAFFAEHFVANYCPLVFFDQGRNLTPDKLPMAEQAPLLAACDHHLHQLIDCLQPEWLIGVGAWAEKRVQTVLAGHESRDRIRVGRILHPSPASPLANRGWAEAATGQLVELGVWSS